MTNTDAAEPTPIEDRVARHLAAKDWLTEADRVWARRGKKFREDYLKLAREVIAIVRTDAVPAAVPPVDRAALRDRIAQALRPHASLGGAPPRYELPFFDGATPSLPRISGWRPLDDVADAVLAELPEPTDRAAVLREAADAVRDGDLGPRGGMSRDYENGWWNSRAAAEDRVRRMAAEAQPGTEARGPVASDQCPHCRVDNSEAWEPCSACAAEAQQDGARS